MTSPRGMTSGATGRRAGREPARAPRPPRGCPRRTAGARIQVAGGGVDRERLVLGEPLPLLGADSRPAARPARSTGSARSPAPAARDEHADPAADRGAGRAQQVGERQRRGPGHVVAADPGGPGAPPPPAPPRPRPRHGPAAAPGAATARHRQHRQRGPQTARRAARAAGTGSCRRARRRSWWAAGSSSSRLDERIVSSAASRTALDARGKRRGDRGGGDEDGPVEPGGERSRDDRGGVPEAERRQVDQRVAARAGEDARPSGAAPSSRSPSSGVAPRAATAVPRPDERASATHSCPRRAASASTYPPRNPLPPVTRSLIASRTPGRGSSGTRRASAARS